MSSKMEAKQRSLERVLFQWVGVIIGNETCTAGLSNLQDGTTFPALVQIVSHIPVKGMQTTGFISDTAKRQNIDRAMAMVKNLTLPGVQISKYRTKDILAGKSKTLELILALFRYHLREKLLDAKITPTGDVYGMLMTWGNNRLSKLAEINNLTDGLRSCKIIAGLIHTIDRGMFPDWLSWPDVRCLETAQIVLTKAEEVGVKKWLYPDHFCGQEVDVDCMAIYLHQFLDAKPRIPSHMPVDSAVYLRPVTHYAAGQQMSPTGRQMGYSLSQPDMSASQNWGPFSENPVEYSLPYGHYGSGLPNYPLYPPKVPSSSPPMTQPDYQQRTDYSPNQTQQQVSQFSVPYVSKIERAKMYQRVQNTNQNVATEDCIDDLYLAEDIASPVSTPSSSGDSAASWTQPIGVDASRPREIPKSTPSPRAKSSSSADAKAHDDSSGEQRKSNSSRPASQTIPTAEELLELVPLDDDNKKEILANVREGKLDIIKPETPLARGRYGDVFKVRLRDKKDRVFKPFIAATVADGQVTTETMSMFKKFLEESVNMLYLEHKNVLRVAGFCFSENKLYRLMEEMGRGDLKSYLQKHKESIGSNELIYYANGIANGMDFLHSNNFIQRAVTCSACWLSDDLVPRISDFGFMRDVARSEYVMVNSVGQCSLPYQWMAPEVLREEEAYGYSIRFNAKTDMYSFGVLLIELFDHGGIPYRERNLTSPGAILQYLEQGKSLARSDFMPIEIYEDIAKPCLRMNASERPDVKQIISHLDVISRMSGAVAPESRRYTPLGQDQDDEYDDIVDVPPIGSDQTFPKLY